MIRPIRVDHTKFFKWLLKLSHSILTAPWSPWWNEVQQALHCLQCVEEVVELSKLEPRTCLTRASRIGGTVHDGLTHDTVKPPLFNIT
jgi:hypothetical protein